MLKFCDGRIVAFTIEGTDPNGGGGGGGNEAFIGSLPEALRTNAAFKDVKDVGDLATRYAGTQKPFAEMLPEKIRGEAYFKDIKSLDALADIAYNQSKMLGADKATILQLPKADDKDGWNSFYAKLGRPEAADKYAVPKRGENQDYSAEEQAFQKAILPVLFDVGATQQQINVLVPKWNAIVDAQNKAQSDAWDQSATKASEALRGEWGAAYDENVALGKKAVEHYGSPELVEELTRASRDGKTIFGDNPQLARVFYKMGKQLQEDGLLGKGEGQGGAGGPLSPAEAKQQINSLMGDETFKKAYTTKEDPGHTDAVEKMRRLYEFANPST